VPNRYYDDWAHGGRVVTGGVAFSPDGSTVYALTSESDGRGVALFRAPVTLSATKTTLSAKALYKKPAIVTATVVGGGTGRVGFYLRARNRLLSLGVAPVVNGVATRAVAVSQAGTLEAAYFGDLTHIPSASAQVPFKPASQLTVKMSGASKIVHRAETVYNYASYRDVRVTILLDPKTGGKTVYVTLWKFRKDKWRDQGYTKYKTDTYGKVKLVFREHLGGKLSFTAWYAGDSGHAETGAAGPAFAMAR
jgi:FlaG/FlaF family flagellin (archaellin)